MRREMNMFHLKPTKALADVEQSVAAFENTIYEHVQSGGLQPSDSEMKDDLLRMLPEQMQLDLLWQKADANVGFSEFRDTVATQSARVMNIQKPQRGIHQVDEPEPAPIYARAPEGMEASELAMLEGVTNADELIAAFQNPKGKRTGGDPWRTAQGRST